VKVGPIQAVPMQVDATPMTFADVDRAGVSGHVAVSACRQWWPLPPTWNCSRFGDHRTCL